MSKPKRTSLYLSANTMAALNKRDKVDGEPLNLSGAVNEIVTRYTWVMRQSLPELTSTEWQHILNVYAGSWMWDQHPPARIASDMLDNVGAISVDDLEPSYRAIVVKAHGWSQAQQYAVLDFVQQFWARDWSGYADFAAIQAEISGKA